MALLLVGNSAHRKSTPSFIVMYWQVVIMRSLDNVLVVKPSSDSGVK
jgi:hypothetical protein